MPVTTATATATTTTTTAVTAAAPSNLIMSLSSSPESTTSAPSSPHNQKPMVPFTPGQCLFCPQPSPSFSDSVTHMQKSHGLFVPHPQRLAVDLETLFAYLHLVIFGYRECIHCGTERATVQAVQQHMTGKGHCKFDVAEPDSEYAEFYDFTDPEDGEDDPDEGDYDGGSDSFSEGEGGSRGKDVERGQDGAGTAFSTRKPVLVDADSLRLPSGKIISRQSPAQTGPSFTQLRRQTRSRTQASQIEYTPTDDNENPADTEQEGPSGAPDEASTSKEGDPEVRDRRVLSKREKRERATAAFQMANMSADDRNSLIHLPASQQRAMLAAQHRHAEKARKEERRSRAKIDRKGNKNLYAYWNTETPVYQCG